MQTTLLRQLLWPSQQAWLAAGSRSSSAAAAAAAAGGAAAAAGGGGSWQLLQRCRASTSTSSNSRAEASPATAAAADVQLTPEQQQHVEVLRYLVARPLRSASDAALLTGLAASYRDLWAVMDQMHKRDILGVPRPLVDEPPAPAAAAAGGEQDAAGGAAATQQQQPQQPVRLNSSQMFLPVRDLTKLPDQPPPPGGWLRYHLQAKYMTRVSAYAQVLPNHLEINYHTTSYVFLWPPMEAFFPGFLDINGVLRYLQPHVRRLGRRKRSSKATRVRCSLGAGKRTPYHKQRVFGAPHVPPSLQQAV